MNYQRVDDPESCARVGTPSLGGHCLVCGFDVNPYAGREASVHELPAEDTAEYITCWSDDCRRQYYTSTQGFRLHWASLPAKHLSSFGNHGCYSYAAKQARVTKGLAALHSGTGIDISAEDLKRIAEDVDLEEQ